ncbi:polysaccharide biosynthesis tyrosine autokinase [Cupriavidus cauae]|uniref:Polysaccharide biosynthesis tyrosine autokinase n=1 Tax=Cupriavidus cauae TaxID=2608999 RepID=A0A5M8AXP8_9BURK|nr:MULTISPECIES: polysaccharide biosynthesis tyrosine autokinase [Cupriavidus]KAA0180442.1 polysaccharide biosynthesis tyrosine autokinase [Cupriavidus gilardii]KAA6126965.1 polysaccharide biosynthesis tyrosine autokinase [Cupriavidus cauae]MCA7083753.1 polysaccharide biosynthesis tyrosine autokinase [Cupriavidus sp. DB3]UZN52316.1 polysaccharide biosynthesis tyrosine autokinase [Cupriavidus cauae]
MNSNNIRSTHSERADERDGMVDLTSWFDVLARYRWTFLTVAGLVIALGAIYALIARPVYRADIMVQVEESTNTTAATNRVAAQISPVIEVKSAASAEIELLQSRMVVGRAVDNLMLNIEASPRYFPIVGRAIAQNNSELSQPGLFGWGGFAWGSESIAVSELTVPAEMDERKITVTALGKGDYRVSFASDPARANGKVGEPLTVKTAYGPVNLTISKLDGRPGAQFELRHLPRLAAIARLQQQLHIMERGKQSGVIGVTLEGDSPQLTAAILNEIGMEYVEQNVRRKAAEAEKSLEFLQGQMPQLRQQVEAAESRYNAMRNQRGTVDLSEESKLILAQSVQIQTRLQELKQKRQELAMRFVGDHPSITAIDSQIDSLTAQLNGVTGRIQRLPDVEQNVLRLMRDVKVNTELYQALLNDVQQLKLMKASKVGTARLVDPASVPLKPVRPNRPLIVAVAVGLGVLAGLLMVVVRRSLDGGLTDADEIEQHTGLTVYATIPQSQQQARKFGGARPLPGLLALQEPEDPAMESLRSFRTALQFALVGSRNRIVVITGPAPGVGKSFIAANFAAILGAGGKRVALVDADLRRGGLNHRFGSRRSPGLSDVLLGTPLDKVVQRQVAPGLDFIPTGTQAPQPADMLNSPGMEALIDELKSRYDVVLIDSPPVLAAADAGILASRAGAVFLVARADVTTASELQATDKAIRHAGGDVKGVLFNGLHVEGRWYRSHYHFGKYRYMNQYSAIKAKRA